MTTQNGNGNKGTALAPAQPRQADLKALFERSRAAIAQVVPRHFTADRILKLTLAATNRQPELAKCTQTSILQCVMTAAALGLEPNTPLGLCYFVPFYNSRAKVMECTFITGYKGLIELARRSGHVATIEAHPIFDGEYFDHAYGLNPRLEHRIMLKGRGELIGSYSLAQMTGGAKQFTVCSMEDIEAARKASKTGDSTYGPWALHRPAMAAKTAVRRLGNQMPMSVEIRGTPMHMTAAVDAAEAGNLIESEAIAELAQKDELEAKLEQRAQQDGPPPREDLDTPYTGDGE